MICESFLQSTLFLREQVHDKTRRASATPFEFVEFPRRVQHVSKAQAGQKYINLKKILSLSTTGNCESTSIHAIFRLTELTTIVCTQMNLYSEGAALFGAMDVPPNMSFA
jgi:hypothetical protein